MNEQKKQGTPARLSQKFLMAAKGPSIIDIMLREEGASYRASFDDKIVSLIEEYEVEQIFPQKNADLSECIQHHIQHHFAIPTIMVAVLDQVYPVSPGTVRNNKVTGWVLDRVLTDTHNGKPILAEDFYKIGDDLAYFEGLKNVRAFKGKHVTDFGSLHELSDFLKPFEAERVRKREDSACRYMDKGQKNEIMRGTTMLYEGPEGKVVMVHTPVASQYWGNNTKWCISGNDPDKYFNNYNEDSPVIMILPHGKEKYALVSNTYYDSRDNKEDTLPSPPRHLWSRMVATMGDIQKNYLQSLLPSSFQQNAIIPPQVDLSEEEVDLSEEELIWRDRIVESLFIGGWIEGSSIDIPEHVATNRRILLDAIERKGQALQYADPSLRKDKEFVLEAVRKNGQALQYADPSLRKDKEIVLEAVRNYALAFDSADPSLRKDKEFVLDVIRVDIEAVAFVDTTLTRDPDFIREAMLATPLLALQIRVFEYLAIPDDIERLQQKALCTLVRQGRIQEVQGDMRFIEALWGDKDRLLDPFKAADYLDSLSSSFDQALDFPPAMQGGGMRASSAPI